MRATLVILSVVALLAALAGCDLLRVAQPSNALLVRVESSGGECPQGGCSTTFDILRDGRVVSSGPEAPPLSPDLLAGIIRAIDAADWPAILARPFTGECPRNFDGQEMIYTFPTATGNVVVESCTTQIDPGQEPFVTITDALFAPGG